MNPFEPRRPNRELRKLHRMCWRKLAFKTEGEARLKALRQPVPLKIYKCPNCSCWHMTSRRGHQ